MAKSDNKLPTEDMIDTVLAEDIRFDGTIRFGKSLKIKGSFKGEILAPKGHLLIGSDARITADINAGVVSNFGMIEGNVNAAHRFELYRGSKLTGDLQTGDLLIQPESHFNGKCNMPEATAELH